MSEKKLNLLADFSPVTTEEWMEVVHKDLRGADFNRRLVWRTNEDFEVNPFYRAEDVEAYNSTDSLPGKFPYVRGAKPDNDWLVRQDLSSDEATVVNQQILELSTKGVTAVGLHIKNKQVNKEYVAELLEGVDVKNIELNFKTCCVKVVELTEVLVDYFAEIGVMPYEVQGSINFDLINNIFRKGKTYTAEYVAEKLTEAVNTAAKLPFFRVIGVNAISLSNSGAYVAQELGYALAWGNEYLSTMINQGVDIQLAAKKIKFNFGVGSNYFMEIAKFRAAKWLWAFIVKAYEPICRRAEDCPDSVNGICYCAMKMRLHAETTKFNKTVFDPYVNMLRTQTEAMSASLGGVNSMTVLPFDSVYQKPDGFSERIARNQQLLLKEESHFDKVADPAAGSYYIETLTNSIAEQAWKLFLEIEEKGGFFAEVQNGNVQADLKATADKRLKNVSSRREVLLGTNQFPNFSEISGKQAPEKCHEAVENSLHFMRAAEEFEALRFATEAATKRPKVFMLTIGNLAMRLARAQFSSNFFACAGYEIIDNLGFASIQEGVEAARKADADIIVLCSSDEEYSDFAPQAYELTKGKEILVVAGAPASMDELKAQGIKHFIHVRTNVLEALQGFNSLLVTGSQHVTI